MFVEYSAEVDLPHQEAAELITAHVAEMEGMGAVAYRRGEELRTRVGPGGLLAKEVVIALGPPAMSRRGDGADKRLAEPVEIMRISLGFRRRVQGTTRAVGPCTRCPR